MTYDPDRDARAPNDVNPNTRSYERPRGGSGLAVMLGLIAVLIVGGFVFYSLSRQASLATDGKPDAQPLVTTGAGPGTYLP